MFFARTLAMVDGTLHERLRHVVVAPGELSLRLDQRDFVDALERRWADVAVLDPTLVRGAGTVSSALRGTNTPAVLYIHLTPRHALAAVELLRVLDAEVITYGYSDEGNALESAARRTGRATRGQVLLAKLTPLLSRLPAPVRRGLDAANAHGRQLLSMRELAAYCDIHRATLSRGFRDAGVRAPHDLVTAFRIVHHYDSIACRACPMHAAARDAGFATWRALTRACARISGFTAADLRAGIPLEQFCDAVACRLCTPRTERCPE